MKETERKRSSMTLDSLMKRLLELRYFVAEGSNQPIIPVIYKRGSVPLVVVLGPNASGKSFFRRIVRQICREKKVECMDPSMELRVGSGMTRAFVFGDEGYQSTGEISGHSILSGISTCQSREHPHVIFWDEPDVGLSEGYAAGAGRIIAKFANELPETTVAAFVVTHSKPLVRQLVDIKPYYVHLGDADAPPTMCSWLDTEEPVKSLETLSKESSKRFRGIQNILNSVRKRTGT